MKECALLTRAFDAQDQTARYAPLGLLANPFFGTGGHELTIEGCEIVSESNRLLGAIVSSALEEKARPIWVTKNPDFPSSFSLAAESRIEETISNDNGLNMLHAYIPLFAMKSGAVRSALTLLGERLTFRDFDLTLAAYVEKVLASPDSDLASYGVMGPEALAAFSAAFEADPRGTIIAAFGTPEDERKPEFAEVTDLRQMRFDGDGDPAEAVTDEDEIDTTVGDAPGTGIAVADEAGESRIEAAHAPVVDYIIDYTREHLSPVIGRALRVYSDRGLTATAAEFNITKAPRKTFSALVQFARSRFSQVVLMWDGFENWGDIEVGLRSKIVGLLSELRWALDGLAVPVFLVDEGVAPELEDSFGSAVKLRWDYATLTEIGEDPDAIAPAVIDRWLASAAVPGVAPLTMGDPGVAAIASAAEGSMARFIRIALEAVEDAADRGVSLDDGAIATAVEAVNRADAEATGVE
jgi:hypothetical protein